MLLEDQHGPQTYSIDTAATHVNSQGLGLLKQLVPPGRVECNHGALALSSEVLHLTRILLLQSGQALEDVVADGSRVLYEVQPLDLLISALTLGY